MRPRTIYEWLSTIPDEYSPDGSLHSRKRRRIDADTPYDKAIMFATQDQSAGGRQIHDDKMRRDAHGRRMQTSGSEISYSLSDSPGPSSSSSERSQTRHLPRKHMVDLRDDSQGLRFRPIAKFCDTPESLTALLEMVDDIMDGKGIVSTTMRDELTKLGRSYREWSWACKSKTCYSGNPEIAGLMPAPEAVMKVLGAASECVEYDYSEANWGLEVHQRVLELAFRPLGHNEFEHLVNFMGSTTASIMPAYGTPSVSKKVDYCVYIDPERDSSWASLKPAIIKLGQLLPGKALKFTEFAPLHRRPIAFSIETKKTTERFDEAKLQLGVWAMAHWSFLRRLVQMRSAEENDDALPPFIPGILIQGNLWFLIFTTMEEEQTQFWHQVPLGATDNTKGIYQIVRNLQVLRQRASDTYWPWLRKLILTEPFEQP